ncbi:OLC1v1012293C1 [Oldenlandia corymbosa var. corymbosa]|uniref:OLC1v1012293C1 n=1 Tax=Oldenlandia corymbosa var. corymbosa TaxID=529605 RepID=A0AAV1DZ50_OLDCO|nr:OLC1v1012293C1 [Oldenlandia corymbosa var. corymbosa]
MSQVAVQENFDAIPILAKASNSCKEVVWNSEGMVFGLGQNVVPVKTGFDLTKHQTVIIMDSPIQTPSGQGRPNEFNPGEDRMIDGDFCGLLEDKAMNEEVALGSTVPSNT